MGRFGAKAANDGFTQCLCGCHANQPGPVTALSLPMRSPTHRFLAVPRGRSAIAFQPMFMRLSRNTHLESLGEERPRTGHFFGDFHNNPILAESAKTGRQPHEHWGFRTPAHTREGVMKVKNPSNWTFITAYAGGLGPLGAPGPPPACR